MPPWKEFNAPPQATGMELLFEEFHAIDDAQALAQVRQVFLAQVKAAPSVHDLFFPGAPPASIAGPAAQAPWVADVATALVASSVSRTALYGFAGSVDQTKADAYWRSRLTPDDPDCRAVAQAIYDVALVKTTMLSEYLTYGGPVGRDEDGEPQPPGAWEIAMRKELLGRMFAEKLMEPAFINVALFRLVALEPDWRHKLAFALYKAARLHPDSAVQLREVWGKVFPDLVEADTRNTDKTFPPSLGVYVPATMFVGDQFIGEVNAAIGVRTQESIGDGTRYIFGDAVAQFVNGTASRLRLSTGADFGNTETIRHGRGRGH